MEVKLMNIDFEKVVDSYMLDHKAKLDAVRLKNILDKESSIKCS